MIILQSTGLSGSGKTSLSRALADVILSQGFKVRVLDGDDYRKNLCADLGYSKADRIENVTRLGRIAEEARRHYDLQILAVINPYDQARNALRRELGAKLIWLDCDLEELTRRDTKSLYSRARLPADHPDRLSNLSGVNDPFELPQSPDLYLNTGLEDFDTCLKKLIDFSLELLGAVSRPIAGKPEANPA